MVRRKEKIMHESHWNRRLIVCIVLAKGLDTFGGKPKDEPEEAAPGNCHQTPERMPTGNCPDSGGYEEPDG